MQDLELAWQTYEFHCKSAINKGLDLTRFVASYNKLLDKDTSNFSESKKRDFRFDMVNCLNKVIENTLMVVNDYKKQNASIQDLIEIYKYHTLHGVPIPEERAISIRYLFELINANVDLIKHLETQKQELRTLLP